MLVNPLDYKSVRPSHRTLKHAGVPLWGLAFGPRGETRLLVWAETEDQAFATAADWLSSRVPTVGAVVYDGSKGSMSDDIYKVAYRASNEEFYEEYG